MISRIFNTAVFVTAFLFFISCDLPQRPQIITISKPPVFRPAKPSDIKDFAEAMAAIITTCRENLQLPAIDSVQLLLYRNSASFAFYGYSRTTLPLDVAHVASKTQGNKIHINLEKLKGQGWGKLTDLLAHEYGHVIHHTVGATDEQTTRWFREGFADWVAARVLHYLQWQDYSLTLRRAELELINSRDLLTDLRTLDLQWGYLSSRLKSHTRTYTLAFVAAHQLIEGAGIAATLQYLQSGDFTASFHVSLDDFEAEFDNYLSKLRPTNAADPPVMQKPEWSVGYQWIYEVKAAGARISSRKEVVREDKFEGIPAYVVKMDDVESFYAQETLERLGAMKNGKLVSRRDDRSHDLSWPLVLGKQWKNAFTWEDLMGKTKHEIDLSMVVAGIERITVPAGNFVTARIEGYDSKSGRLLAEYWYSPTTKWFVRTRAYDTAVLLLEEELTEFRIDPKRTGSPSLRK